MNHLHDLIILDGVYAVVALAGLASGCMLLSRTRSAVAGGRQAALPYSVLECRAIAAAFMAGALPFAMLTAQILYLVR